MLFWWKFWKKGENRYWRLTLENHNWKNIFHYGCYKRITSENLFLLVVRFREWLVKKIHFHPSMWCKWVRLLCQCIATYFFVDPHQTTRQRSRWKLVVPCYYVCKCRYRALTTAVSSHLSESNFVSTEFVGFRLAGKQQNYSFMRQGYKNRAGPQPSCDGYSGPCLCHRCIIVYARQASVGW